jgi:hypothetical protein
MKGFLQRLAAGTIRPERTVHPFVGAIFQGGVKREQIEETRWPSGPTELLETVEGHGEGNETKDHAPKGEPTINVPEGMPLVDRVASAEPPGVELPIKRKAGEEVPTARVQKSRRKEDEANGPPNVEPFVLRPLVMGVWPQSKGEDQNSGVAEPTLGASQVATRAKAALPEREAPIEDIQIHIGRIEVIAVPPQAQRASAVPGRKGMSLDDYLRQRNGRAR